MFLSRAIVIARDKKIIVKNVPETHFSNFFNKNFFDKGNIIIKYTDVCYSPSLAICLQLLLQQTTGVLHSFGLLSRTNFSHHVTLAVCLLLSSGVQANPRSA